MPTVPLLRHLEGRCTSMSNAKAFFIGLGLIVVIGFVLNAVAAALQSLGL